MDEVTLVGAGLIGAGIATLGLALLVVGRCAAGRGRTRRPSAPRPSRPRPAPARPAPAHPRPDEAGLPRLRPAPDPAPRRRPPAVPTAIGEALDGETLLLGPVPAWRLPVHQRTTTTGIDAARGDEPSVPPDVILSARARGGVAAALFTRGGRGPRPVGADEPARAERGPDDAAGAEPARFGWFRPGR